jgi:cytochrome c553
MKKIIVFSIIACSLFLINSCTNYSKQTWLDAANCNTTNITYTNTVKAIMNNNTCSGCHGAGGTSPELSNYSTVKNAATNANFIGCLKHTSPYSAMPKNGTKLDSYRYARINK